MEVVRSFPSPEAFCELRDQMGWHPVSLGSVERAFTGSIVAASIFDDGELLAFGRVAGDTALYLYLQDVMVAPAYQRAGLGTMIVHQLLGVVQDQLDDGAFLGLLATPGSEKFYRRFGFVPQTPKHTVMELSPTKTLGEMS
jgi:GNAT superfamily N-acetyltransferase